VARARGRRVKKLTVARMSTTPGMILAPALSAYAGTAIMGHT
jgi:hypothetical protein